MAAPCASMSRRPISWFGAGIDVGWVPLVMKPLIPTSSRAKFGPVIVIHRGTNRLQLFNGTTPVRSFRVSGVDWRTAAGAEAARLRNEVWAASGW